MLLVNYGLKFASSVHDYLTPFYIPPAMSMNEPVV